MASPPDQDGDDLIRITHYINPHNFWFKHESAYLYNAAEAAFQSELSEFCENTYGRGNIGGGLYTPHEEGEVVALFFFPSARWIRAEVDEIQTDLSGNVQCNLWAIDEGLPVKSSNRYIKPLPNRFAQMASLIKRGGLAGILPAETSYDYLQGRSVYKKVEEWSPGVARVFEECIAEAMTISFGDLQHYVATGVDMYYGTMRISSHQNVTNNAVDLLYKAGQKLVMLVGREEFYDELPRLRVQDMRRFENNERRENMKYHVNAFRAEFTRRSQQVRSQEKNMIEQAREKFLEWDLRNTARSSTNASLAESNHAPVPKPPSFNSRSEQSSGYMRLTNEESLSSDEDDDFKPTIDVKLPPFKPPAPAPKAASAPKNSAPYQRPQGRIYDTTLADVAPALERIKLRREAAFAASSRSSSVVGAAAAAPSGPNLMPAGYNMGNVTISGGSVILGARQESSKKSMQAYKYRYAKEDNDDDSSLEDAMSIRKLTITKVDARRKGEDEKW